MDENEIKKFMEQYDIPFNKNGNTNEKVYPCWRALNNTFIFFFHPLNEVGTSFNIKNEDELVTILRSLQIKKKPDTFESKIKSIARVRLETMNKLRNGEKVEACDAIIVNSFESVPVDDAIKEYRFFLNKTLTEISKLIPSYAPSADYEELCISLVNKIDELRPK